MQALKFSLSQVARDPVQSEIDAATDWIIVFNAQPGHRAMSEFPYAQVMQERRGKLGITEPDREPVVMDLPNAAGSRVALACIKADLDAFKLLTLARKLVAVCRARKASTVQAAIAGFDRAAADRIAEAIIAATAAVAAQMPSFKHSKQPPVVLHSLKVYGIKARHGFRRPLAEAEGNAVARYLSMLPANKLTPALYQRERGKFPSESVST